MRRPWLQKRQEGRWQTFRLSQEDMHELFAPIVQQAVDVGVKTLYEQMNGTCHYVFVVGGFGQCKTLQNRLQEVLRPLLTEIPPGLPARLSNPIVTSAFCGSAIVQGAALFGLYPDKIPVRRSAATVAQVCMLAYDSELDKGRESVHIGGRDWCPECMKPLIRRGDLVNSIHPEPAV